MTGTFLNAGDKVVNKDKQHFYNAEFLKRYLFFCVFQIIYYIYEVFHKIAVTSVIK